MKNVNIYKKSILLILAVTLMMCFTACTSSEISKVKDLIKGVELSAYMEEEQDYIKELKEDYLKDLEKVKDEKDAKKLLKSFKADLATYATKEDKVKTYKELLEKQFEGLDATKKEEAEKTLKSYEDKLKNVKSNKDFDKLTAEINKKITSITGATVTVTSSEVETSTPAAKNIAKQQTSSNGSSSKGGSSSISHAKQKVWVVDQAAWTETKQVPYTAYKTVYVCDCGYQFDTLGQAGAHSDAVRAECGAGCGYGPSKISYTAYETQYIQHPEQGHWEYR